MYQIIWPGALARVLSRIRIGKGATGDEILSGLNGRPFVNIPGSIRRVDPNTRRTRQQMVGKKRQGPFGPITKSCGKGHMIANTDNRMGSDIFDAAARLALGGLWISGTTRSGPPDRPV